jgi:integrase
MIEAKRLSARKVDSEKTSGMYADGEGLYLIVSPTGAKRWLFVFQYQGKRKEMGLGSLSKISLAAAREAAEANRKMIGRGLNPIDERKQQRSEAGRSVKTFGEYADALVDTLAPGFRNAKHIAQWRTTFKVYCAKLRPKRLDQIETADVLEVLTPLWQGLPETGARVRGRIERVLDAAKAEGLRDGDNPARWRGHLASLLPKRQKLTRGHHAAMPYADVPAFIPKLRAVEGIGAKALLFLILVAKRPSEVAGMRWPEVDLDAKVWTIPPSRMKAGREHREPLSDAAVELLRAMLELRAGDNVFPGSKSKSHVHIATISKALDTAGGEDFTAHGFRSSFRDWTHEQTAYPDTLAEAALAHIVGDATERAYRRGDALERRRELMSAWANYVTGTKQNNVTPISEARRTA